MILKRVLCWQKQLNKVSVFTWPDHSVTSNNLLKTNFAFHNLAHHSEIIPIIPEFKQRIKLFDTGKIPYIIEEGERAAEAQLSYLKEFLGKYKDGPGETIGEY